MAQTGLVLNYSGDEKRKPLRCTCSGLSFLTTCDCCQWREHHSVKNPRGPFPSVFGKIDRINRDFYQGKSLKTLSPDLPEGTLDTGELWVQSRVFEVEDKPVYFTGRLDAIGTRSDGAGFVVPDFKTVDVKTQHLDHYQLQLNAYALALENPAPGRPVLAPVTDLGLLCLMPRTMKASPTGKVGYVVEPTWVPLERNDEALFEFVATRILRVLELPESPAPDPTCEWCNFIDAIERGI
jgi:hypothetical protein